MDKRTNGRTDEQTNNGVGLLLFIHLHLIHHQQQRGAWIQLKKEKGAGHLILPPPPTRPLFKSPFVLPTHDNNKDVEVDNINLASIPNRALAMYALILILTRDCHDVMHKVTLEQFQLVCNEALFADIPQKCLFLTGPVWHPQKKLGGSAMQRQCNTVVA